MELLVRIRIENVFYTDYDGLGTKIPKSLLLNILARVNLKASSSIHDSICLYCKSNTQLH